ncbi:dTDP-4-dehydrorhamnose reductase [Porticoccus sp. W117]|uniref:dTDP-4-dehydrorhamnose reductase n=1 Tax=Porticoccus sp. W117 TaxID=3054777 RepID=UPI0025943613|nr:dTDP-4-dehydrorhamnose reductase [Porticoccus sp. W117]MDM3870599.1 dTDP-4-dehydrorhamnose reductase [Porticoccus sp. W117]
MLIVGAGGQLGRCLCDELTRRLTVFSSYSSKELDVTDLESVQNVISLECPAVVINAAAYTAVDQAEEQKEQAFSVNATGAENLARACEGVGAVLVHVSTDYVFHGKSERPYTEVDAVNPINVYGSSKLLGEELIAQRIGRYIIVRTSWVFSEYGSNFFKTMSRLALEKEQVSVVDDQYGCPTYAGDLASALLKFSELSVDKSFDGWGIYHYCGSEQTSWYEFAKCIFQLHATQSSKSVAKLSPLASKNYPTPAKRPQYSVMSTQKATELGIKAADWKTAIKKLISAS